MSAPLLLNLLNELRIRDKMRGLPSNEIYKFNKTGARMSVSIYHMTLKLIRNRILV